MQKKQRRQLEHTLARAGALEQARQLIEMFPDLIDDLNKLAPKRRLSATMRAELAEHLDASTNGSTPHPKRKGRGGVPGRKWSAAQKRKFMATVRRKAREKRASASEAK